MASLADRVKVSSRSTFVFFGIIILAGYWFMIPDPVEPLRKENEKFQTEASAAEKKLSEMQDRYNNRAKFEGEMERVSQTFRLALEYLPKELDVQDLLKKVYIEARNAGVELNNFKPKDPVPKEFYDELPIEVSVRGTFTQLMTFMTGTTKLHRIINVQNVELATTNLNTDGQPLLDLKGIFICYRFKESK